MSSIIEGYSYDIFISYRQNDNKYDGWVTEFVDNLNKELEATIKDKVSVYFDINPHDGLLETHSVDLSLEVKLKCLIFIPVISQTYCDSKSFAWQHEFCAFNKLAKEDLLGRDIRLSSGNVASRILPVKIHDLDPEDKSLLEDELGGVLRSIEFIYKSAGVNRPLRANEDHPHDNLNKTYYRDQINKVANAVKEIINTIRKPNQPIIADPKEGIKAKIRSSRSLKTKILVGSLLVFALMVFGYLFIPMLIASSNQVEKSIAVLPFINDSPDQENTYFINGLMDEILNNLQKIKDFRVLSRTSTEQYRGSNKPRIPKIAKELGVNYIVEGSGQKYGNTFRLRVQLIAANNEKHLWAKSYEQEIKETKDIFNIQSQIAQSIASELKAAITPDEKRRIEKTPTTNLTAYDFYQRGREEISQLWFSKFDQDKLKRAETLFHKTLEYDSTFAQAYTGLAEVLWDRWWRDQSLLGNNNLDKYLDSMQVLADIALSFDDQLAKAYYIKGECYSVKGSAKQAIEEWGKAIRYNPNDWNTYWLIGGIYEELDLVKALENLEKAASLNHGQELVGILTTIGRDYYWAGFPEKGKNYFLEALQLDGDSAKYKDNLIRNTAETQGNFKKAAEFYETRYSTDSTNPDLLVRLGYYNSLISNYHESLKYYKKYVSIGKSKGETNPELNRYTHIGFAYLQNGYRNEAEYYFDKQIEAYNNRLTSVRPGERIYCVYPLAAVYACMGDKTKACENLEIFNQNPSFTLQWVMLLKNDPQFNSIRNEPKFQRILKDVEAKYQAEHERVRKWLEEKGEH